MCAWFHVRGTIRSSTEGNYRLLSIPLAFITGTCPDWVAFGAPAGTLSIPVGITPTSAAIHRLPVDICDVCELAPAVFDMIGTYQSIFKDYPSVFHRLSGS